MTIYLTRPVPSISSPHIGGISHVLQIYNRYNIHNREWKKEKQTNKHGLGLALSVRREKFWHFHDIMWLLWACTRTKFPPSYQELWFILLWWLTWLLGPLVPTPHFSNHIIWPWPFPDSSLFCCETLPFLVFLRSRRKSRVQHLCVGFTPKQTKEPTDWRSPTPTPTEQMPTIVPQ